jgi:hypothetical protein
MNDSPGEEESIGSNEKEAGQPGNSTEKRQEKKEKETGAKDDRDARIEGGWDLNRPEQGKDAHAHGDADVSVSDL